MEGSSQKENRFYRREKGSQGKRNIESVRIEDGGDKTVPPRNGIFDHTPSVQPESSGI
ncbi:hypothetical protein LEP1GSC088_0845 [Leptospira interrogans str. L1207]|nr:hypothetical protein LEP1GSC088_0845 [Leptospira interrogans str. L1207]